MHNLLASLWICLWATCAFVVNNRGIVQCDSTGGSTLIPRLRTPYPQVIPAIHNISIVIHRFVNSWPPGGLFDGGGVAMGPLLGIYVKVGRGPFPFLQFEGWDSRVRNSKKTRPGAGLADTMECGMIS